MAKLISLGNAERADASKSLVKAFVQLVKAKPDRTPQEIVDVVYTTRKNWFDHLSDDDLDYFSDIYEKVALKLQLDLHWDVSVKYQLLAYEVFNKFIDAMKKLPSSAKRDHLAVAEELNIAYGSAYGTGSRTDNILRSWDTNPQLREVGKRLVIRLGKMGYAF